MLAVVTLPPIIIVLGTMVAAGLALIRLYSVMMWRQFNSCRLYSWIRFTWNRQLEIRQSEMSRSVRKLDQWAIWYLASHQRSEMIEFTWKSALICCRVTKENESQTGNYCQQRSNENGMSYVNIKQGGGIDFDSVLFGQKLSHFHFVLLFDGLNGALEPGVFGQSFQLHQLLQMSDPFLADVLEQSFNKPSLSRLQHYTRHWLLHHLVIPSSIRWLWKLYNQLPANQSKRPSESWEVHRVLATSGDDFQDLSGSFRIFQDLSGFFRQFESCRELLPALFRDSWNSS